MFKKVAKWLVRKSGAADAVARDNDGLVAMVADLMIRNDSLHHALDAVYSRSKIDGDSNANLLAAILAQQGVDELEVGMDLLEATNAQHVEIDVDEDERVIRIMVLEPESCEEGCGCE